MKFGGLGTGPHGRSAADVAQGAVEADAAPDGDGIGGTTDRPGTPGRDHESGGDQGVERRGIPARSVDRAQGGDRPITDGHHDALAGPGPPHVRGQVAAQFPDPDRRRHAYTSVRITGCERPPSA